MPSVLFDDVTNGTCKIFEAPVAIIRVDSAGDVESALTQMQEYLGAGFHLAGYFSYELGYVLEHRLATRLPADRMAPLLWFGVFKGAPQEMSADGLRRRWQSYRAYAGPVKFEWDAATYADKFAKVAEYIRNGDLYQANLSMRGRFVAVGDPRGLYLAMRAQGGGACSAYVDDGACAVLSFSPELFFAATADGTITCKPMKGTAARVHDDPAGDAAARAGLGASGKNRAENLMIVDLVRNDLGRIATQGSVNASRLFEVETYPTVHQMVSVVSAKLDDETPISRLLHAMFPCGSVTGAPKIRAMEVIRDLEASPRGVYCGAIGWFAPDQSARFNVAIRTLVLADGRGELGVGGGLVADSRAADEYAECCLKARYFEVARRPLKLLETMRRDAGNYTRLSLHLDRLETSARVFGFPFDRERILAALTKRPADGRLLRVRLTLDEYGDTEVESSPLAPTGVWRYVVSPERVDSRDAMSRHKTHWREALDAERGQAARKFGCDEVLFCNERDELCEGSRSNLFVSNGNELLTPPTSSGLLGGCLRRELLDSGRCREAVLTVADIEKSEQVYFGNSLRGLIAAVRTVPY